MSLFNFQKEETNPLSMIPRRQMQSRMMTRGRRWMLRGMERSIRRRRRSRRTKKMQRKRQRRSPPPQGVKLARDVPGRTTKFFTEQGAFLEIFISTVVRTLQ